MDVETQTDVTKRIVLDFKTKDPEGKVKDAPMHITRINDDFSFTGSRIKSSTTGVNYMNDIFGDIFNNKGKSIPKEVAKEIAEAILKLCEED